MILKYKNEYNDYYEFLTFQLRERLNVLEKRKYILVYLLVPFLAEFDCCHTHPMITLPIGCKIELNATEKQISIIEE